MPLWFEIAKWLHVGTAVVALLIGPIAMYVEKRRGTHVQVGTVYVWMMGIVFVTAWIMSIERTTLFLLGVSVLSFYTAFTGKRAFDRRRNKGLPTGIDHGAAWFTLVMGGILLVASVFLIMRNTSDVSGWLGIVFGAASARDAIRDMSTFRKGPQSRNELLLFHIERILGSFIGLLTALSVQTISPQLVNMGISPSLIWIVWVGPTVIGLPLIAITQRRIRERIGQPRPALS